MNNFFSNIAGRFISFEHIGKVNHIYCISKETKTKKFKSKTWNAFFAMLSSFYVMKLNLLSCYLKHNKYTCKVFATSQENSLSR
jgi:hypothetical protein